VAGPDGALWFTEPGVSQIGRITPDGTVTNEYPGAGGSEITVGPDGNLWFTFGDQIGRMTLTGEVTWFSIPTSQSISIGITRGPDGNLWFTENWGQKIGRITPTGVVTEFPLPSATYPAGITAGPDGALWFAEFGGQRIAKISVGGVITEFETAFFAPWGIASGPFPAGTIAVADFNRGAIVLAIKP
jgi:virginiamycin B lyase